MEAIVTDCEVFFEQLVTDLSEQQKKIRKTGIAAFDALIAAANPDEDPRRKFRNSFSMKLTEINLAEYPGIDRTQLLNRIEALRPKYQAKLERQL
ncbi:MAG: hypothetical protein V4561_10150 [Bacteroidota bacterium]